MKPIFKLTILGLIILLIVACGSEGSKETLDIKFFQGKWTYRSLHNISDENIEFSRVDTTGNKDSCKCISDLRFAQAVMNFTKVSKDSFFGFLDMGEGYALNLKGKAIVNNGSITFYIQGSGVAGTATDNWEYDYNGYIPPKWENGVNQLDACVGSVIRAKPHGASKAGKTASFYMVKQ